MLAGCHCRGECPDEGKEDGALGNSLSSNPKLSMPVFPTHPTIRSEDEPTSGSGAVTLSPGSTAMG